VINRHESRALEPLDHQLRDPVAPLELDRQPRVVVDQQHLDLAAVARVDGARGVHDRQAVPGGEPGPGVHQGDVPLRQRDRDPGRHQRPLPRFERHVDRGHQVGARVAGVRVGRQRQPRVEQLDGDLEVGRHGPNPSHTSAGAGWDHPSRE
jgi:hypothetical protein